MKRSEVVVVDYGMGNLFSISRAISYLGGNALISAEPKKIEAAERLILPGVGAFGEGMKELKNRHLIEPILSYVTKERPFLGICLGMQIMLTQSDEFGKHNGLNLFEGNVIRFREPEPDNKFFKIPHFGWNKIFPSAEKKTNDFPSDTVLKNIPTDSYFYFVHSYYCQPLEQELILAESEYGLDKFCAVMGKNNIYGCQFHPERSGQKGLALLKTFLYELNC